MTDTTRQRGLPGAQEKALIALLAGATVTAAAAGVSRQTVSGWINRDAAFISELRNRGAELRTAALARLEAAVPAALDALTALLEHSDWRARVAGADRILRALDRPRPSLEPGEVTAESVKVARERDERHARNLADLLDSLTP